MQQDAGAPETSMAQINHPPPDLEYGGVNRKGPRDRCVALIKNGMGSMGYRDGARSGRAGEAQSPLWTNMARIQQNWILGRS